MSTYNKGKNKNVDYLMKNGPTPQSGLPYHPSTEGAKKRICTFNVKGFRFGFKSVAYLEEHHSAENVLRVWMKVNDFEITEENVQSFHARISKNQPDEFKRASRQLFKDEIEKAYAKRGGTKTSQGGPECPMCGEPYDNYLPQHLENCEGD